MDKASMGHQLLEYGQKVVHSVPTVIFGAAILLFFWGLARLVYKFMPLVFRKRAGPSLLHEVIARVVSFLVFVFGIYLIFEMAGLTTMAVTVISGTGILGIIVGIAFRDIAENFLAGLLLSMQNPFRIGDHIDIIAPSSGYTVSGSVESLTLRVTILILSDGSHLQIPNATVYKSNIRNYSYNLCFLNKEGMGEKRGEGSDSAGNHSQPSHLSGSQRFGSPSN